jgi:type III pantothenate kinase
VASAVGGLIDTVVDGTTGILIPPRNPDRLGEELRALLADPARRRALGEAGAQRARSRYTWDRIADATLEAYTDLLEREPLVLAGARPTNGTHVACGHDHLAALVRPLRELEGEVQRIEGWGRRLARVLLGGGRLLAVGNGGSAAQAQHLTGELVGRYCDDRPPFSALALHSESSSLTAIANDYGADEAFARQVRAHGRPGDVLVALTTSGRSSNVIAAVEAAKECGILTWALTGPAPNPVAGLADDAICVEAPAATVQEVHLVAIHLLCAAFDCAVDELGTGAELPSLEKLAHVVR